MYLSIIIPTYNGRSKVLNALQSLEKQTFQDFEVLVVIDGSTDDTLKVLTDFKTTLKNLRIIHQENKGRSVVRNTGVSNATGDFVLFMDDDMRFEPQVVAEHLDFHKTYCNSILVGNQIEEECFLTTDFQLFKGFLSRKWTSGIGANLIRMENPFMTAAHCSLPKPVFLELGQFDERLTDAEDYDLAVRANEQNIDIYFDPKLIGWHDDFITCEKYIQRLNQYKKANEKLVELHPARTSVYLSPETIVSKLKKFLFRHSFWVKSIDKELLLFLPKKIRFLLYDYVVTANS